MARGAFTAVLLLVLGGCGAEPEATDPEAIYAEAAPAIAFIETPLGTGTGVLVQPGRVVTNAHVLWPYERARVNFPVGPEILDAAVVAIDPLRDLALLDVGSVGREGDGVQPLPMRDGGPLRIGAPVYLIGYPGEAERFPRPAFSHGVLSLHRTWDGGEMRFLQTDADIGGGQSGGALLDSEGRIVGISGLIFGEGGFALAADVRDAFDWLARAPEHDPRARSVLQGNDAREHLVDPGRAAGEEVFVLSLDAGRSADVALDVQPVNSDVRTDPVLQVLSPYGDLLADVDDHGPGEGNAEGERATVVARTSGPHFVVVTTAGPWDDPIRLTSDASAHPLLDPDDGNVLHPGTELRAAMDFPGDIDVFELDTSAGGPVEVIVDTINFNPDLTAERIERGEMAFGEPGVGNTLGMAARVVVPRATGRSWEIFVSDYDGIATGGYLMRARTLSTGGR